MERKYWECYKCKRSIAGAGRTVIISELEHCPKDGIMTKEVEKKVTYCIPCHKNEYKKLIAKQNPFQKKPEVEEIKEINNPLIQMAYSVYDDVYPKGSVKQ